MIFLGHIIPIHSFYLSLKKCTENRVKTEKLLEIIQYLQTGNEKLTGKIHTIQLMISQKQVPKMGNMHIITSPRIKTKIRGDKIHWLLISHNIKGINSSINRQRLTGLKIK